MVGNESANPRQHSQRCTEKREAPGFREPREIPKLASLVSAGVVSPGGRGAAPARRWGELPAVDPQTTFESKDAKRVSWEKKKKKNNIDKKKKKKSLEGNGKTDQRSAPGGPSSSRRCTPLRCTVGPLEGGQTINGIISGTIGDDQCYHPR